MSKMVFRVSQNSFTNLPGSILCYWLSQSLLAHFSKDKKIGDFGTARQGLSTSDNNLFLRFWYEVDFKQICFSCSSCQQTQNIESRWFPFNKAGNFRKWSSINEYIVNYKNNGLDIKNTVLKKYPYLKTPDFVVKNTDYYFKSGITWNDVSTGMFCARYVPSGFIFADAGPMFFSSIDEKVMLSYFNSNTFQLFVGTISQGLHYSTGQIPLVPFAQIDDSLYTRLQRLANNNCEISKKDWDSFETSWNFERHPLI